MRVLLCSLLPALLLCGCGGTASFKPEEFELRSGVIEPFDIVGVAKVGNAQTADDTANVYSYGSTTLVASLAEITEVLVRQSAKEIDRNGRRQIDSNGLPLGGDATKIIALRVHALESENRGAFYQSKMLFQVTLGNGQVINLTSAHASAGLEQDLDACIADGVVALLLDERVRAYLAAGPAPPEPPPPPPEPAPQDVPTPAEAPTPAESDAPPPAPAEQEPDQDQPAPGTAPTIEMTQPAAPTPSDVPQVQAQPGQ